MTPFRFVRKLSALSQTPLSVGFYYILSYFSNYFVFKMPTTGHLLTVDI